MGVGITSTLFARPQKRTGRPQGKRKGKCIPSSLKREEGWAACVPKSKKKSGGFRTFPTTREFREEKQHLEDEDVWKTLRKGKGRTKEPGVAPGIENREARWGKGRGGNCVCLFRGGEEGNALLERRK